MSLPEIHNFSVAAGDNAEISWDVTTGPIELTGATLQWDLYEQEQGLPVDTTPILTKTTDYGIEAENDGEVTTFSIEFAEEETADLLGNYYYEVALVTGDGKNLTAAVGILTVTGLSTTLSARSLKVRFPELAIYDDTSLQFAIDNAIIMVDDSWIEEDITIARMLLAAHLVTMAAASADTEGGTILSESIGRLSTTYATKTSVERTAELGGTSYGQAFLRLLRASHGGPIIV